jgi:hypothetical protein
MAFVLLGQAISARRRAAAQPLVREPLHPEEPGPNQEAARRFLAGLRLLSSALTHHPVPSEEERRSRSLLIRTIELFAAHPPHVAPPERLLRDLRGHIATLLRARRLAVPHSLDLDQLFDRHGRPVRDPLLQQPPISARRSLLWSALFFGVMFMAGLLFTALR